MSRDDSFLYGGTRSNPAEADRKERSQVKELQRAKLLPVSELVFEDLHKEREATEKQILGFITVGTPHEQVKETLAALNLYDQSLRKFATKMQNKLRKIEGKESIDE